MCVEERLHLYTYTAYILISKTLKIFHGGQSDDVGSTHSGMALFHHLNSFLILLSQDATIAKFFATVVTLK